MFDKIQMILMMKTTVLNNRISRLNNLQITKLKVVFRIFFLLEEAFTVSHYTSAYFPSC